MGQNGSIEGYRFDAPDHANGKHVAGVPAGKQGIIVMGIQTCGKGTQIKLLQERHGATGITMSDEMKHYPDLLADMKAGILVPDEKVMAILETAVKAREDALRLVLDGAPRTFPQKGRVDQILAEAGYANVDVVHLDIPDEEVASRLTARALKENRPDDADPAAVARRIAGFKNSTMVAIRAYEEALAGLGKFHRVNGMGPVEAVHARIVDCIGWAPEVSADIPEYAYGAAKPVLLRGA